MKTSFVAIVAFFTVAFAAPVAQPVADAAVEARDPQFKSVGPCGWTGLKREADGAEIAC